MKPQSVRMKCRLLKRLTFDLGRPANPAFAICSEKQSTDCSDSVKTDDLIRIPSRRDIRTDFNVKSSSEQKRSRSLQDTDTLIFSTCERERRTYLLRLQTKTGSGFYLRSKVTSELRHFQSLQRGSLARPETREGRIPSRAAR